MDIILKIKEMILRTEPEVVITDWHDYNHFLPLEWYSFELDGKLKIETFLSLHNHYLDTSEFSYHEIRTLCQIILGLSTIYCEPKNALSDRNRYYIKNVRKRKVKHLLALMK